MNKSKVIVTGGAGFIGSNLVEALLARGHEVFVVDNYNAGKDEKRIFEDATYVVDDIRNYTLMADLFRNTDVVFHLAALPRVQDSIDDPVETHDVNVNGTLSVLQAATANNVRRVILASSAAVYGDQVSVPLHEELSSLPKSPYGLHKYIGERTLQLFSELYGIETTSLRFFNVYGPRFDPEGPYALVVGRFLKLKAEGKPLTIAGDGTNTRDYVHIDDIIAGLVRAADSPNVGKGEVINLGSGIETSVNELAQHIGGETIRIEARIEPARCIADSTRARELLGWKPQVMLEEGIAELLNMEGLA